MLYLLWLSTGCRRVGLQISPTRLRLLYLLWLPLLTLPLLWLYLLCLYLLWLCLLRLGRRTRLRRCCAHAATCRRVVASRWVASRASKGRRRIPVCPRLQPSRCKTTPMRALGDIPTNARLLPHQGTPAARPLHAYAYNPLSSVPRSARPSSSRPCAHRWAGSSSISTTTSCSAIYPLTPRYLPPQVGQLEFDRCHHLGLMGSPKRFNVAVTRACGQLA